MSGTFYTHIICHSHSHVTITIFINSPTSVPIYMGFPWKSHSIPNPHVTQQCKLEIISTLIFLTHSKQENWYQIGVKSSVFWADKGRFSRQSWNSRLSFDANAHWSGKSPRTTWSRSTLYYTTFRHQYCKHVEFETALLVCVLAWQRQQGMLDPDVYLSVCLKVDAIHDVRERSHNRSTDNIDYLPQWTWLSYTDFVQQCYWSIVSRV